MSTAPQPSEFVATSVQVHGPQSLGCIRHERAAMVSFMRAGDGAVYDLLLTPEQLRRVAKALSRLAREVKL